jgi:hypothetical protein
VQAANAADIVTAFSKDTVFTVTAETKVSSQLTVLCKTVCSQQDFRRITDAILRVAWPSPAYVQYLDTPPGIAGTAATSITAAKPLGVTADALGGERIRLKSDTPVSQVDVEAIMKSYVFGSPAPPLFRMFYQPPSLVLPPLTPPPAPAPAPAAPAATTTAPATDPSDPNANAVKFTVTSDTTTTTTDPSKDNSTQPNNGTPKSPGGTPPPATPAKPAPVADPPAANNQPTTKQIATGTDGTTPKPPETKTTKVLTYTPPPAPAPNWPTSISKTPWAKQFADAIFSGNARRVLAHWGVKPTWPIPLC